MDPGARQIGRWTEIAAIASRVQICQSTLSLLLYTKSTQVLMD